MTSGDRGCPRSLPRSCPWGGGRPKCPQGLFAGGGSGILPGPRPPGLAETLASMRLNSSSAPHSRGRNSRAPIVLVPVLLSLAVAGPGAQSGSPQSGSPQSGSPQSGSPQEGAPGDAAAEAATGSSTDAGAAVDQPQPEAERTPARYRSNEEHAELIARWTANGLATPLELGVTAGGRPLLGVTLAAPGPVPAKDRTTILVVGGLDGASLAGSEAAVRIVEDLLVSIDRLPPSIAVIVLPWANPDGLARTFQGAIATRNDRALDEDQDGRIDEDGPDDLDGDGVVLSMLVPDPDGPFARAADPRFLRRAESADRERWSLVPEGRDDDGDGRFNEDGPGGLRLDTAFPVGWTPALDRGLRPLEPLEAGALAGLCSARRVALALFLQENHGHVAVPGGTAEWRRTLAEALRADAAGFEALRALLGAGGPPRDLLSSEGRERGGHPVDWLYASQRVLAVEWAVWGPGDSPDRSPGGVGVSEGSFSARLARPLELEEQDGLRGVDSEERRWARWLDDTRGGIGYVDWLPVELGNGRQALVGGWEPQTRDNPPPELLPTVLEGVGERLLDVVEALPRLELQVDAVERAGGVVSVRARVRNGGELPTGVGPRGAGDAGVRLELVLPEGATLLAGREEARFAPLAGGAATLPQSWLLRAREHSLLQVRISTRWSGTITAEVRL